MRNSFRVGYVLINHIVCRQKDMGRRDYTLAIASSGFVPWYRSAAKVFVTVITSLATERVYSGVRASKTLKVAKHTDTEGFRIKPRIRLRDGDNLTRDLSKTKADVVKFVQEAVADGAKVIQQQGDAGLDNTRNCLGTGWPTTPTFGRSLSSIVPSTMASLWSITGRTIWSQRIPAAESLGRFRHVFLRI